MFEKAHVDEVGRIYRIRKTGVPWWVVLGGLLLLGSLLK